MPRLCEVCRHPKARQIDQLVRGGATLSHVAGKFGLTPSGLSRHKSNHLEAQRASKPLQETSSLGDLDSPEAILSAAKSIVLKTERLVAQAESDGDTRTAISGVKLMLDALTQFFAKYHRMLDEAPKVDQSTKIVNLLSGVSTEDLRAFLRGDPKPLGGSKDA